MKEEQREKWLEKFVEGYMFRDIKVCLDGYANFADALAECVCRCLGWAGPVWSHLKGLNSVRV